jgi:membrane-associated phospholipid phosphatase
MASASVVVLALAASAGAVPSPAAAPPPERVPLAESFSTLELLGASVAATSGAFLLSAGHLIFEPASPSLSAPDPHGLEARISRSLYRRGHGRLLWSVPDVVGLALPALPLVYYAADTWAVFGQGESLVAGSDPNPHHRLVAYIEAMGITYLITGVVKYSVGRPRPYTVEGNDHPELRRRRSEDDLSFFSGHAATTFGVGAFLAEDLSRAVRRRLRGGIARRLLGIALPYSLGYGLPTFISLSRVVDQQHWPSDVLAGALVGSLVANAVYALHFDTEGRPRRRHRAVAGWRLLPLPLASDGVAAGGILVAATGAF